MLKNLIVLAASLAISLSLGCMKEDLPQVPDGSLPEVKLPSFPLPKSASDAYELIRVAGSSIDINPTLNDPLSVVGRCSDLVSGCYEAGGNTLDGCISGTRRCQTQEPWKESQDCCPTACVEAYSTERQTNPDALAAYEKAFFQQPDCFPGVTALLGGAP